MKTRYQLSLFENSKIPSHNCLFALCDLKESSFQCKFGEIPNEVCVEYFELFKALQEISNIVRANETTGEDIWSDVENGIRDILHCMKY